MITLKPGVRVRGLRPEMLLALQVAEAIMGDVVVTSGTEGKHSRTSLHYAGAAVDIRIRNLKPKIVEVYARQLRAALGTDDFDVVVEATHYHIEYQPKGEA